MLWYRSTRSKGRFSRWELIVVAIYWHWKFVYVLLKIKARKKVFLHHRRESCASIWWGVAAICHRSYHSSLMIIWSVRHTLSLARFENCEVLTPTDHLVCSQELAWTLLSAPLFQDTDRIRSIEHSLENLRCQYRIWTDSFNVRIFFSEIQMPSAAKIISYCAPVGWIAFLGSIMFMMYFHPGCVAMKVPMDGASPGLGQPKPPHHLKRLDLARWFRSHLQIPHQ